MKKDILYFPEWKKYKVFAGITTKSAPLHFQKTDDLKLKKNQKEIERVLRQHGPFAYLHQVHGGKIAVLEEGKGGKNRHFHRLAATDGVITDIPGLTLLAMTADCLPVFLRAPGWVGLIHAGWRGTRRRITAKALKLILVKSRCAPSQVHVIFGPSICGKHYEVGEEFKNYFQPPALRKLKEKFYFDLAKENQTQLRLAGVPSKNIHVSNLCTVGDNQRFYSFRKEKEAAGRMVSFIQLR